jgi:hypothetical protein
MQTMAVLARPLPPLELILLRKSVGQLSDHRDRCVHCHRTPLVGERVHVYTASSGDRLVCDLCRPLRREPPARSETFHSPDRDRAVRIRRTRDAA